MVKEACFFLNVLTAQRSAIQFIDKQAKERWTNYYTNTRTREFTKKNKE
jgi:hypothetical protein